MLDWELGASMKHFINCLKQNNQKVIICCNQFIILCLVIFSPPDNQKESTLQRQSHLLCPPALFPPTSMFSHTQLGRTEARTTQPSPHHKLCSGGASGWGTGRKVLQWWRACGSETNPMSLSQCVLGQDGSLPWACFHNCKMFSNLKYTKICLRGLLTGASLS